MTEHKPKKGEVYSPSHSLSQEDLEERTKNIFEQVEGIPIKISYDGKGNFVILEKDACLINLTKNEEQNIPRYTALNHELSHYIFKSPIESAKKKAKEMAMELPEKYRASGYEMYLNAFNIIEDQRVESLLGSIYAGTNQRFIKMREGIGKTMFPESRKINNPINALQASRFKRHEIIPDKLKSAIDIIDGVELTGKFGGVVLMEKYCKEVIKPYILRNHMSFSPFKRECEGNNDKGKNGRGNEENKDGKDRKEGSDIEDERGTPNDKSKRKEDNRGDEEKRSDRGRDENKTDKKERPDGVKKEEQETKENSKHEEGRKDEGKPTASRTDAEKKGINSPESHVGETGRDDNTEGHRGNKSNEEQKSKEEEQGRGNSKRKDAFPDRSSSDNYGNRHDGGSGQDIQNDITQEQHDLNIKAQYISSRNDNKRCDHLAVRDDSVCPNYGDDALDKLRREGEKDIHRVRTEIERISRSRGNETKTDYTTTKLERGKEPYKVNYPISSEMNKLFRRIQNRTKLAIGQDGEYISIPHVIQRKAKGFGDVMLREKPTSGLTVLVSIDASGSMDSPAMIGEARNMVATLYDAIKSIKGVNLHAIVWAGGSGSEIGITEVADKKECEYITCGTFYQTPTPMALDYSMKRLMEMKGNKKIMFFITDGQPAVTGYDSGYLTEESRKAVIRMQRHGIKILGIFVGGSDDNMKEIFKDKYVRAPTMVEASGVIMKQFKKLVLTQVRRK